MVHHCPWLHLSLECGGSSDAAGPGGDMSQPVLAAFPGASGPCGQGGLGELPGLCSPCEGPAPSEQFTWRRRNMCPQHVLEPEATAAPGGRGGKTAGQRAPRSQAELGDTSTPHLHARSLSRGRTVMLAVLGAEHTQPDVYWALQGVCTPSPHLSPKRLPKVSQLG